MSNGRTHAAPTQRGTQDVQEDEISVWEVLAGARFYRVSTMMTVASDPVIATRSVINPR